MVAAPSVRQPQASRASTPAGQRSWSRCLACLIVVCCRTGGRESLSVDGGPYRKAGNFVRRVCASTFAVLALATIGIAGASAQRPSTVSASKSCRGAVSWQTARKYMGRYATIKGPVAGSKYAASSNGSPTFLNIGVDYPNPRRVTVVIWGENRARFGSPERRYRGHTLCVRGLVEAYGGVPEIEVTSPAQITVAR
jgi:hypothetical protein